MFIRVNVYPIKSVQEIFLLEKKMTRFPESVFCPVSGLSHFYERGNYFSIVFHLSFGQFLLHDCG